MGARNVHANQPTNGQQQHSKTKAAIPPPIYIILLSPPGGLPNESEPSELDEAGIEES